MENNELLSVSASPHVRLGENTRSIMLDVILALLAPLVMSVIFFRLRALSMTIVAVISCVVFEYLYQRVMKKPVRVGDLSAVVTGMLLAFNLPASVPYWMIIIGSFFAIVVVKQLFGGIGKNFMNPALAARVFLLSWANHMTTWPRQGEPYLSVFSNPKINDIVQVVDVDGITGATPLMTLKRGVLPDISIFNMFLGYDVAGCIGEISSALLLVGALLLLFRRVITLRIPVAFIGTVAVLTYLFPKGSISNFDFMIYNVLGGGLFLGAFYMATDYTTSPARNGAQWIYGIGCGLITVLIRYFGTYPEGVSFSILIMNATVWLLDRKLPHRRYGVPRLAGIRAFLGSFLGRKPEKGGDGK